MISSIQVLQRRTIQRAEVQKSFNCVAAHDYWSAYPATLLVDIRNRIHKELSANSHNTKFWASEYCILERMKKLLCQPLRNEALT